MTESSAGSSAFPRLVARLVRGDHLERSEAEGALGLVLSGEIDPVLISGFLTALSAKGATVSEMAGFVDAMMASATTVSVPTGTMDLVGTGGDLLHTVNLTTMAALAVAGCGVRVAKHGNRAASSSVGTADVLEALGVRIDAGPEIVARCVDEAGMGFLFAPRFHHGLRHLGPIRRQLGFPTVFNVLGPLANPARVRHLVVGVADGSLIESMAAVLRMRGADHAVLVRGDDGLDELSLGTPSTLVRVGSGGIETTRLDAAVHWGSRHDVSSLVGGDVEVNARKVREFLEGRPGAIFDTATANAGLALQVAGRTATWEEGARVAAEAVRDGAAATVLESLVRLSQEPDKPEGASNPR
jgi:anthranilate phosphoribosyltransferase